MGDPSTATLLGMRTRTYKFQPVAQIKKETDFQYRRPSQSQWWMKIRSILAILSQHDSPTKWRDWTLRLTRMGNIGLDLIANKILVNPSTNVINDLLSLDC